MVLLFWDASALVKRYTAEIGRQTVNALFAGGAHRQMATTLWGYAETYAILLRRLNGGVIDLSAFTAAVGSLQAEVLNSPEFGLLSISDAVVLASISTMRRHNLNATDAAILTMLLEYVQGQPPGTPPCLVISSDHRLLRAATAEGFPTLNPETVAAADVPVLLASL